jgi:nitric oxide reductase activation protein
VNFSFGALAISNNSCKSDCSSGKAIRYLTHHGFSRQERPEAAKVALIFTDGKSKHPQETKNAAAEARNQGIFLISIGIEEQSDLQELLFLLFLYGPFDCPTATLSKHRH